MLGKKHTAPAAVAALAIGCGSLFGCVADRPSRNGVFNENQYLRKDFLIAPGDGTTPDQGWFVKQTIVATSTPNPLGYVGGAGLYVGSESYGEANLVRFEVTQDKLNVLNMRELTNDPNITAQGSRVPETVNAWPITNVDLKYQINLDGEKTNFYQENQELDWQVRQWVKLNFAKNDLSDLYAFGANTSDIIQKCVNTVDSSETLVTNSFMVDEPNEYFQFELELTLPIAFAAADAATCQAAFGPEASEFFSMGRQNVTLRILTAFVRPDKVVSPTYVPMPIAEKDPIQHKYGAFQTIPMYRDPNTGLLDANQYVARFDPNKDHVYYFAPGMPATYQQFFLGADGTGATTGLEFQTNQILAQAGAKGRLKFLNYNDATTYLDAAGPIRVYGDPRYSFVVWHADLDNSSGLLGVAPSFTNPLTGETLSATVNIYEGAFKDTVLQRLQLFLETVGGESLLPDGSDFNPKAYPATCTSGQTIPLVPSDISKKLNAQSTVYNKMQAALQKPFASYGYLGPADFIPPHVETDGVTPDPEFWNAYYAIIPYQTYADPQGNAFVNPEGSIFPTQDAAQWTAFQNIAQFEGVAGQIDQGMSPFDIDGATAVQDAANAYAQWTTLGEAVTDYTYTKSYRPGAMRADDVGLFSYFDVYKNDGRHCVNNAWESLASYTQNLVTSLNMVTAVHEFGHTLGLTHNFMGSVDQRNFPVVPDANNPGKNKYAMFTSSVMEYSQSTAQAFYETTENTVVWAPYDAAAIGWIYGNNLSPTSVGPVAATGTPTGASGQVSSTAPWNDPLGFKSDGVTEIPFLFCGDWHMKYTPLCRQRDTGATPAEITANAIENREWNYLWTNFREYHKYFSEVSYPTTVVNDFNEMRRFASLWNFDWSGGELTNTLRLIGTPIPAGSTAGDYYNELTAKFNTDISMANQLAITYQRAIVDQSSGERPYITQFDPYYGDVTQQGIQLDKLQATAAGTENWAAITNYDPTQANGAYISSLADQIGDSAYTTASNAVLADYLGAAFATFSYAQVGPISSFAANSHSQKFPGNLTLRDWVGGLAFTRERDFLDYVHQIAVTYGFQNCDQDGVNCQPCTSIDQCTWDPRTLAAKSTVLTQSNSFNEFQGPDGRSYIWGYIQSRNEWVLADQQRNVATYNIMLAWTTDVVNGQDDGYNGANALEKNVRFVVDSFTYYDGQSLSAP